MTYSNDVSVLVSTMWENEEEIKLLISDLCKQTSLPKEIIFVVQFPFSYRTDRLDKFFTESDSGSVNLRWLVSNEKGLSKSRNTALSLAKGDVVLFSDTDCRYREDAIEKIKTTYEKDEISFATFKAENKLDNKEIKKYSPSQYFHNVKSLMKVASWEITAKTKCVFENDIFFDERFGLGAPWPSGEENIFLVDIYRTGYIGKFVPEAVVQTDPSHVSLMDKKLITGKGAMIRRIWGIWGLFFVFPFVVKRHLAGDLQVTLVQGLVNAVQGFCEYGKAAPSRQEL